MKKFAGVTVLLLVMLTACSSGGAPQEEPPERTTSEETAAPSVPEDIDALNAMIEEQNNVVRLLYGYVRGGLATCARLADPGAFTACIDRSGSLLTKARTAFDRWRPTVEPAMQRAGLEYNAAVIREWLAAIDAVYSHEKEALQRFRGCLGAAPSTYQVGQCIHEIGPFVLEGLPLLKALAKAERKARRELPFG